MKFSYRTGILGTTFVVGIIWWLLLFSSSMTLVTEDSIWYESVFWLVGITNFIVWLRSLIQLPSMKIKEEGIKKFFKSYLLWTGFFFLFCFTGILWWTYQPQAFLMGKSSPLYIWYFSIGVVNMWALSVAGCYLCTWPLRRERNE